MRSQRAFRPAGDALEARCVLNAGGAHLAALAAHHALLHPHAEVHHAAKPVAHAQTTANPTIILANLFPFAAGTTYFNTIAVGGRVTTVIANTSPTTSSTIFAQVGGNTGIITQFGPGSTPGSGLGPGGDLNGLVIGSSLAGTAGGDLNGLVIF